MISVCNKCDNSVFCKECKILLRKQKKSQNYYDRKKRDPIAYKKLISRMVEKRRLKRQNDLKFRFDERKKTIQRAKERYKKDPIFKLSLNLRNRLNRAVERGTKTGSAVQDLGCSISDFKIYLESKFQPGMTWENHGEWHIDHIIPLSKVDLKNVDEFKKAVHFTNLQPLWAKENIKKSNKVEQNG